MSATTRSRERTQPGPVRVAGRGVLWVQLLCMVLIAAAGLELLVTYALHDLRGVRLDQRLMDSLGASEQAWMHISDVLTRVTIGATGLALLVCLVVAVSRRRWALAASALVLVAGANLTTEILKFHVLHRVGGGSVNSLPSGHTTVSLSLALAALLVAPTRWRGPVAALGAFVATFVAAGTIAGHWHRPADVLAAQAVCLAWSAVAIGLAALLQRRRPLRLHGPVHLAAALIGSSVVGLVFVALGVRPTAGDVNLPMAALALVPVGLGTACVLGWVASVADRHTA